MLVGVDVEGGVARDLEDLRIGFALFLLYSPRTARASVLKAASAYVEVLEAVGFDHEHRLEVFLREGRVVVRVVVGRVGVLAGARRVTIASYFSGGYAFVPRNIMCSKKWAKPDLPGSTSLREPVCTGICSETMFGKPVGTTMTFRPFGRVFSVAWNGRMSAGEAGFCVWASPRVAGGRGGQRQGFGNGSCGRLLHFEQSNSIRSGLPPMFHRGSPRIWQWTARVPPAYEREPYRTLLETSILETGDDEGRAWAVLEDTVLYPEGGGQPPDHGLLNGIAVQDVQKAGGRIRHSLASSVAPGTRAASARLGEALRSHAAAHGAAPALRGGAGPLFVEDDGFPSRPRRVRHRARRSRSLSPDDRAALEDAVAVEIRAARPVTPRRVTLEEFRALPVRTRGLPDGHTGDVRLVEIAGVDLNTCGGTHLSNTAEIEIVCLLSAEPLRGGIAALLRGGAAGAAQAGDARGSPPRAAQDPRGARLRPRRRREREASTSSRTPQRLLRRAEEELAAAAAKAALASGLRVVHAHFEGRDMAFVQTVARRFAEEAGPRAALFTATREGQHVFALGLGDGFRGAGDAQALGREIASLLEGKGGGSGRVFQGKAPGLSGWTGRSRGSHAVGLTGFGTELVEAARALAAGDPRGVRVARQDAQRNELRPELVAEAHDGGGLVLEVDVDALDAEARPVAHPGGRVFVGKLGAGEEESIEEEGGEDEDFLDWSRALDSARVNGGAAP